MNNELLSPQTASEWIVLLSDNPEDDALQVSFRDWFDSDVLHQEEWLETLDTWRLLGMLGPSLETQLEIIKDGRDLKEEVFLKINLGLLPKEKRNPSSFISRHSKTLMSLVLVFFSIVGAGTQYTRMIADASTGRGEVKVMELVDGSRLTLAPETIIDFDIGEDRREIEIHSGAVYFEVSRDEHRPFIVTKEGTRTRVLGTSFLVDERDDSILVAVSDGLVQVSLIDSPDQTKELKPGDKAYLSEKRGVELSSERIEEIASWRKGYLTVRERHLSSVVNDLDRFYEGHIFIQDEVLAQRRLTGVFKLDNPRKSIDNIASLIGMKVTEVSPWIIILSKK